MRDYFLHTNLRLGPGHQLSLIAHDFREFSTEVYGVSARVSTESGLIQDASATEPIPLALREIGDGHLPRANNLPQKILAVDHRFFFLGILRVALVVRGELGGAALFRFSVGVCFGIVFLQPPDLVDQRNLPAPIVFECFLNFELATAG